MRSPFAGMWGLAGIGHAATLARYSLGGKAPAGISAAASDGALVTGSAPTPLANILGAIADFTYRGDFCLTEFAIYVGNPGTDALQEATS